MRRTKPHDLSTASSSKCMVSTTQKTQTSLDQLSPTGEHIPDGPFFAALEALRLEQAETNRLLRLLLVPVTLISSCCAALLELVQRLAASWSVTALLLEEVAHILQAISLHTTTLTALLSSAAANASHSSLLASYAALAAGGMRLAAAACLLAAASVALPYNWTACSRRHHLRQPGSAAAAVPPPTTIAPHFAAAAAGGGYIRGMRWVWSLARCQMQGWMNAATATVLALAGINSGGGGSGSCGSGGRCGHKDGGGASSGGGGGLWGRLSPQQPLLQQLLLPGQRNADIGKQHDKTSAAPLLMGISATVTEVRRILARVSTGRSSGSSSGKGSLTWMAASVSSSESRPGLLGIGSWIRPGYGTTGVFVTACRAAAVGGFLVGALLLAGWVVLEWLFQIKAGKTRGSQPSIAVASAAAVSPIMALPLPGTAFMGTKSGESALYNARGPLTGLNCHSLAEQSSPPARLGVEEAQPSNYTVQNSARNSAPTVKTATVIVSGGEMLPEGDGAKRPFWHLRRRQPPPTALPATPAASAHGALSPAQQQLPRPQQRESTSAAGGSVSERPMGHRPLTHLHSLQSPQQAQPSCQQLLHPHSNLDPAVCVSMWAYSARLLLIHAPAWLSALTAMGGSPLIWLAVQLTWHAVLPYAVRQVMTGGPHQAWVYDITAQALPPGAVPSDGGNDLLDRYHEAHDPARGLADPASGYGPDIGTNWVATAEAGTPPAVRQGPHHAREQQRVTRHHGGPPTCCSNSTNNGACEHSPLGVKLSAAPPQQPLPPTAGRGGQSLATSTQQQPQQPQQQQQQQPQKPKMGRSRLRRFPLIPACFVGSNNQTAPAPAPARGGICDGGGGRRPPPPLAAEAALPPAAVPPAAIQSSPYPQLPTSLSTHSPPATGAAAAPPPLCPPLYDNTRACSIAWRQRWWWWRSRTARHEVLLPYMPWLRAAAAATWVYGVPVLAGAAPVLPWRWVVLKVLGVVLRAAVAVVVCVAAVGMGAEGVCMWRRRVVGKLGT